MKTEPMLPTERIEYLYRHAERLAILADHPTRPTTGTEQALATADATAWLRQWRKAEAIRSQKSEVRNPNTQPATRNTQFLLCALCVLCVCLPAFPQATNTPITAIPTTNTLPNSSTWYMVVWKDPGSTNSKTYRIDVPHLQTMFGSSGSNFFGAGISNLSQMLDVNFDTGAQNNDMLVYSSGLAAWVNRQLAGNPNQFATFSPLSGYLTIKTNAALTNLSLYGLWPSGPTNWGFATHFETNYVWAGRTKYALPYTMSDISEGQFWEFSDQNSPKPTTIARLQDVTNVVRTAEVLPLTTNSVLVIDCALTTPTLQIARTANTGYNITVLVTNITAGLQKRISILGPSGSNYVTWVWEPWVRAQWPVDPFTDLPTTNTYLRSSTYTDFNITPFVTNNVRIEAAAFK